MKKKTKNKKTTNNFPENVKCTETATVPHFITVPKFSSFSNRNYRIYSNKTALMRCKSRLIRITSSVTREPTGNRMKIVSSDYPDQLNGITF